MSGHIRKVIQVFEHEKLRINEVRQGVQFSESHWQMLLNINEKQFPPYFRVIHQGIQLTSYVGVISIPGLTLEILPKADVHSRRPGVWQNLLLDMLAACEEISPYAVPSASLHIRQHHLLDIWLGRFLELTENLLQEGLMRQYETEESNRAALQGKLIFSQHIRHNIVHRERFFTRHQSYEQTHLLHQMLSAALTCTEQLTTTNSLQLKARQLRQHFPACSMRDFSPHSVKAVSYNRQTLRYRPAIELARLILSHLSPVLKSGSQPTFSLLFDMNRLFETYVYRQLKKAAYKKDMVLHKQTSTHFWAKRSLRPDMLLQTSEGNNIILDTKWKILKDNQPADEDLKQIYIYNHYFRAQRGILLYPRTTSQASWKEAYHQPATDKLYCEVQFVNILSQETQRLNPSVGEEILLSLGLDA